MNLSDRLRTAGTLLALTLALTSGSAHADGEAPAPAPAPLESLRERFRAGKLKYDAAAYAEAIVIWESVYRELGPDKGYRVAFDLARAYGELGEQIKAAEHYETYLERVAARRRDGELLEAHVEAQETEARAGLEKIAAIKGRIHIKAAVSRAVIVRVDNAPARVAGFTLYVEPGDHTVTFGAGNETDVRRVTVTGGALLEVDPPDAPPPPPPETRFETHVDHPFSPTVLWIGAGVAVVSLVIPAITYANALSIKSDYEDPSTSAVDRNRLMTDYESARTNAYASIIVPALFTAAVGTLAVWYVLGTKETRRPVTPFTPAASVGPAGASVDLRATF